MAQMDHLRGYGGCAPHGDKGAGTPLGSVAASAGGSLGPGPRSGQHHKGLK